MHSFLQTQEVTGVTGVYLVQVPLAPPENPWGPKALSPTPDWELWRGEWTEWLTRLPPQCQGMAADALRPRTIMTTSPPHPCPHSTTLHCPWHTRKALGGSGSGTPAVTHACQDNSDVRL